MYRIFMIEDDEGIMEAVKNRAERWGLKFSLLSMRACMR